MSNFDELTVGLGDRSYPIYITTKYDNIVECLKKSNIKNDIVIITDANVDKIQIPSFINILTDSGYKVEKYVIKPGEESKNLKVVEDIYRYLVSIKLDRTSTLIAFGGGVVGDITGFVAATYLRGINFVQVPTTLLAQSDSSVGGKTGVDFEGAKNIIGAFYQPKLVYININSLVTLPVRELKSGLAEVIKHGIIKDAVFFDYLNNNFKKIFDYNEDVLRYMIKKNCIIKSKVVEEDEKEKGLRAILNFGHTIGHAVESVSNFKLLHGECISIGMVGAFKIAKHFGIIDEHQKEGAFSPEEVLVKVLKKFGLPTRVKDSLREVQDKTSVIEITPKNIYRAMHYDKKIKSGKLLFVLPKQVGDVGLYFIDDEALIMKGILEIMG